MNTEKNTSAPELKNIAIDLIRESKTNPRKHFSKAPMKELSDSILTQGIRQPILVRPKLDETPYEIVAGARRYRAAKLAGLDEVPCVVSVMSDREALEIQVVENLQREDLTELEEAESYQSMLALREDDAVCYTVPQLAARFGISESKIYQRLKLLDLSENGRKALEGGQLGARQAVLIGRIPDPVAREQALEQVLHPKYSKEPLTYRETEELISEKFMKFLAGAPFKLADAELVPAAGACSTCPKMTDNCRHLFSTEEAARIGKRKVCTDPECFRAKVQMSWVKQTEKAAQEGMTVLDDRKSREIFPEHYSAGDMDYSSPYVMLGKKPDAGLLKPEVVESVGTWRSLLDAAEKDTAAAALEVAREKIRKDQDLDKAAKKDALALLDKTPPTGVVVPRVLARDQGGVARELVDRKLAIVAIEQAGEPIFLGKVGNRVTAGSDDFAKQRKREMEAAKLRLAESIEGMTRMHAALVAAWVPSPVWESLFEVAMGHAGADGLWLIGKWKGLKFGAHNTGKDEVVAEWAMSLPANERQALVPLLLIGQQMKCSGLGDAFEQVSQGGGLGLDIADIRAAVKGAAKDAKKAPKQPKAKKKSKAEKRAEADAAAAAPYGWNANGVAEVLPDTVEPMGEMPHGTRCVVTLAFAPDGKWRYGLELESRMEGKQSRKGLPSLAGPSFAGGRAWDDALMAGFTEALAFFKDDPVAFRVVAEEADPDVAEALEGEGGGAPVTVAATLDPQVLAQWVKAHAEDMPIEEIARSFGVPVADVQGALEVGGAFLEAAKRRGKRTKITPEVKQSVHDMVCAGRTLAEIAKDLGISLPMAQNIKKELGLVKPKAPAAADDERYAGLPESTHAAIDLITAGKTTHEVAAGAGITIADVIRIRQQLAHDAENPEVCP